MHPTPGPLFQVCAASLVLVALLAGCRPVPTGGTPVGLAPTIEPTAAAAPSDVAGGAAATGAPAAATTAAEMPSATSTAAGDTASVAPEATPADTAADYIGLSAQGGTIGGAYELTDLRTGRHEGFTRIVWELDQVGSSPQFEAVERSNTADPVSGASVAGAARIEVKLHDTYARQMTGRLSATALGSPIVLGVTPLPSRDDTLIVFAVALARPARFEVVSLEDPSAPTRIVLDVFED